MYDCRYTSISCGRFPSGRWAFLICARGLSIAIGRSMIWPRRFSFGTGRGTVLTPTLASRAYVSR
jgi:hypothetical protein